MSVNLTPEPNAQIKAILECLRQAVNKTLERKRRLGHYSVQWSDGKILVVGDDAPETLRE